MLEIQMIVATAVIGLCVGFFFYIVKLFNQEQESSSTGIENSANDIIKSNTDGDISKPRRKSESVSQSCDRKWGKNLQKWHVFKKKPLQNYTLFNHAFSVHKCASSFPMDLINKVLLDAIQIIIQSSFEHITLVVMLKKVKFINSLKIKQFKDWIFLGNFLIFNFPTMHL